ncbi:MAG: hypothetical protein K8S22_07225, partial [Betaproteobacteria bacterium]|nr:hypothetical protein [Betaproteobacteria bacterium]
LQFGGSLTALTDKGASLSFIRNEGVLDFSMDYGLPGKPGYSYSRPFDYFSFQATASSANIFENVMTRGLLVGKDYEAAGGTYKGVWGLYGSYDYIAPQIFRVSTSALSLGTTAQWQLTNSVALQGTGLFGVGYGAAGTIHGVGERDYHYGVTPQGLLALRLIMGERVALGRPRAAAQRTLPVPMRGSRCASTAIMALRSNTSTRAAMRHTPI